MLRAKRSGWYLQAASGAILCDDAHVWWINAGTNEARQVFVLNISHLLEHNGQLVGRKVDWSVCRSVGKAVDRSVDRSRVLTCFSSKRTFLVSSIRFLFIYLMAARFPCRTQNQYLLHQSGCQMMSEGVGW